MIVGGSEEYHIGGGYPTQKPVKLLKMIIKLLSKENHWCFDPCAGSGSFGKAAFWLGRHVIIR